MMTAIFFVFFMLALLLMFIVIKYDLEPFWNFTFILIDIVLWYLLSASIMELENPWTAYNATSGIIENGYTIYTSPLSPYLTYFFSMMGTIMVIYFVGYLLGPAIMDQLRKFKIIR